MAFQFAYPLMIVISLGLMVGVLIWHKRFWYLPAIVVSDTTVFSQIGSTWRSRLHRLPDILLFSVILCLLLALARPQFGSMETTVEGQGIDIVLALDISGSMASEVFGTGTRLEAAQQVLDRFIASRVFDRIGLVVFAQQAFQSVPPTIDYLLLRRFLIDLRSATDQGLTDGTAIGSGLAAAGNMLRSSAAPSKIIILLTDGANNAGRIGPLTAAEALNALDIRVYTVGMIAVPGGDLSVEQADEATLQQIAEIADGNYFRATDRSVLDQIYAQIDSLERSDIVVSETMIWEDQGIWLVWSAFGLLVTERVLRVTYFSVLP